MWSTSQARDLLQKLIHAGNLADRVSSAGLDQPPPCDRKCHCCCRAHQLLITNIGNLRTFDRIWIRFWLFRPGYPLLCAVLASQIFVRSRTNRDVCYIGVTMSEPSSRSNGADFPARLFESIKFLNWNSLFSSWNPRRIYSYAKRRFF